MRRADLIGPGQTAPARGATEAVSGGVSKWGVATRWTTRRPENLFHSPKRVMTLKASYGVCRMPGFKYPTTEANVRRAIIFRSGGVFVGSVCRQSPACGAARWYAALPSLPRFKARMTDSLAWGCLVAGFTSCAVRRRRLLPTPPLAIRVSPAEWEASAPHPALRSVPQWTQCFRFARPCA